ncbi:hypothetical protein MJO28_014954, partial [Puccinia striiformis f. sp. tritici]
PVNYWPCRLKTSKKLNQQAFSDLSRVGAYVVSSARSISTWLDQRLAFRVSDWLSGTSMSDTGGGDSTGGSVGELVQGGGGAFFILVRAIGQVGRLASPVSISPALTGMNLTGISISPALIGINPTSSHWYQSHQLSPVSLSHPLSPALTGMNLYGSHQLSPPLPVSLSHQLSSVSISPVLISPVSLSHQLSSVSISPALIGINLT